MRALKEISSLSDIVVATKTSNVGQDLASHHYAKMNGVISSSQCGGEAQLIIL